jgi:outer membrane protein
MKFLGVMVLAGAAALPAAAAETAPAPVVPKVAVIDVQRLVAESAAGKEAQNRVKKVVDSKQVESEKLQKELQGMQQKLSDQGPSMSDEKRDQLNKEYQEKGIAYKRFQDDAQREVQEAQQKELNELERRVMPVINQVGKEKGYTLIFNKYAPGMLVYADDQVDITEEVLHRFNAQVTQPPAGKEPEKGPKKDSQKPPVKPGAKTPEKSPGSN